MATFRTYKTSTRAPETLMDPITAATREREILRYLEKHPALANTFELFCIYNEKLLHASEEKLRPYQDLFEAVAHYSPRHVKQALKENTRCFSRLKKSRPQFRDGTFLVKDLPPIVDPRYPSPELISKHDYIQLVATCLEYICKTANDIALKAIPLLPLGPDELFRVALENARRMGSKISEGDLLKRPEKQIMYFLGEGKASNLEQQIVFKQVHTMMEVYWTMLGKAVNVHELLSNAPTASETRPDFSDAIPVLACFEAVSKHLHYHLAFSWKVDMRWVWNALIDWSRKINPLLPFTCQVGPLSKLFTLLAAHTRSIARSQQQHEVIGMLQRHHVLHLLGTGVDLSPLVPVDLQDALKELQDSFKGWPRHIKSHVDKHVTSISRETFLNAAVKLKARVNETINSKDPDSKAVSNCETFLKKIDVLERCENGMRPFLENYLPGSRYTLSVATLLSSLAGVRKSKVKRLHSALRGFVAIVYETLHPEIKETLLNALANPETCVTRPYMSINRKKNMIPLELRPNKYVIIRKENPGSFKLVYDEKTKKHGVREKFATSKDMTRLMSGGVPVWIGIPLYTPDQFDPETGIAGKTRHGLIWLQVVPTKKIIECLQRGAKVKLLRIHPPRDASKKIVVDVILAAKDRTAFSHRTRFIAAMDALYTDNPLPAGKILCNDLNAVGRYMIAVGVETSRINLVSRNGMMKEFIQYKKNIEMMRIERGRIQAAIERGKNNGAGKIRRQATQLELLDEKKGNVHAHAENRVVLVYAHVTRGTGATHVGWDGVNVSTRGTKGVLAKAITDMPKRAGLLAYFMGLCGDLKADGYLLKLESIHVTPPYTSQICDECLAKSRVVKHTRDKTTSYHVFSCTRCKKTGTSHVVAARVPALLLELEIKKNGLDGAWHVFS